jgi:hypothetical protein
MVMRADRLFVRQQFGPPDAAGFALLDPTSGASVGSWQTAANGGATIIANGKAYVYDFNGGDDRFITYDASSNGPQPQAVWFGNDDPNVGRPIAATNRHVYSIDFGRTVTATDAAGETNCSGIPIECRALWSYADIEGGVTIARDLLVAVTSDTFTDPRSVAVYDALGALNCAGTPKICTPLWSAPIDGVPLDGVSSSWPPRVLNGLLYAPSGNGVAVFGP